MHGPISILKVQKPSIEEKSNRSRSADAVRAIFYPPEKENNRIQLAY